jgi:hypothetical protein
MEGDVVTRKSKRELTRDLETLETDDPMALDGADLWDWIHALTKHGSDVARPPEYFPDGAEWIDELQEMQATAADRYPELEHLTPPEAYVLCYMGEGQTAPLVALLSTSDAPAAQAWRQAVSTRLGLEDR